MTRTRHGERVSASETLFRKLGRASQRIVSSRHALGTLSVRFAWQVTDTISHTSGTTPVPQAEHLPLRTAQNLRVPVGDDDATLGNRRSIALQHRTVRPTRQDGRVAKCGHPSIRR